MKLDRMLCISGMLLMLGATVPAGAQSDNKQQDHQEGRADQKDRQPQGQKWHSRQNPAPTPAQGGDNRQRRGGQGSPQPQAPDQRQRRDWQQRPQVQPPPQRRYSPPQPQPQPVERTGREQNWSPQPRPQSPAVRYQPPVRRNTRPQWDARRGPVSRVEAPRIWENYRARDWRSQHRTWGQRGGYQGYRIPTSRFRVYFGPTHRFNVSSYQLRVQDNYPQFQADGYWFELLDPVPEYWSYDWYQTDDVTIVELEDGYYLMDSSYPDDLVAVSVYDR